MSSEKGSEQTTQSTAFGTFATDTTLHGIKGVVAPRLKFFKFVWLLCLLGSFALYVYLVQRSVRRYYSYPFSTVYRRQYVRSLDFPAVSICSPVLYQAYKMSMNDSDPHFKTYGLDIPACTETRSLRNGMPCGDYWFNMFGTSVDFLDPKTLETLDGLLNMTEFINKFAINFDPSKNSYCWWNYSGCEEDYLYRTWSSRGFCYTFNSGVGNRSVLKVDLPGRSGSLILSFDISEIEAYPHYSETGIVVILHRPGEHFDPQQEGFYTTPGARSQILIHTEKVKNLKLPYITNCTDKKLKESSVYTQGGCRMECFTQYVVDQCGCKVPLSKGSPEAPVCSLKGLDCARQALGSFHYDTCDCPVACDITRYKHSISFFQQSSSFEKGKTDEYIKSNIISMELRFEDLSYTEYEQTGTYDIVSLLGELGGNMGLFLGCSILTVIEFIEFVLSLCAAKQDRRKVIEINPVTLDNTRT